MVKDTVSEGTWLATNGFMTAAILNGYKTNHVKKPSYKASRGTIIPSLFKYSSLELFYEKFEPDGFEPFTLIVFHSPDLVMIGWDGEKLETTNLGLDKSLIFSSVTLYNEEVSNKRKQLYHNFINPKTTAENIWELHLLNGDNHFDFLNVKVNDEIQTVSTCQIVISNKLSYKYQQHLSGAQIHQIDLNSWSS